MDPTVVAAWIAASVSVLTLIGTVIVQFIGYRSTRKNTEKQIKATHEDTSAQIAAADKTTADTLDQQRELFDQTIAEQRGQLDLTLTEQSKQLDRTLNEQRTRTWNERFGAAAGQLGSDKPAAVRLAGVYAMAGLADDWKENRQTCVDILCAYLRLPYEADPGDRAPALERFAFQASREVRQTVIRVITRHLQVDAHLHVNGVSWRDLNFDFTGVVFDGAEFRSAKFSGTWVDFNHAKFSGDRVDFSDTEFSGAVADFRGAEFSGTRVDFSAAKFSRARVDFSSAKFSGTRVDFSSAKFSGGHVDFSDAEFSGTWVDFNHADFSGARVDFSGTKFCGGKVDVSDTEFPGFGGNVVQVNFNAAKFSGKQVSFRYTDFSGGADFSAVADWSIPPAFPWTGTPPTGVKLPPEPPDH